MATFVYHLPGIEYEFVVDADCLAVQLRCLRLEETGQEFELSPEKAGEAVDWFNAGVAEDEGLLALVRQDVAVQMGAC